MNIHSPPKPWFKLQPPSQPQGPEDTFCWCPPAFTPSTRLPPLCGAAAPPPLHDALTSPREACDTPGIHLEEAAYVISILRALRVCPRSGTWGTGLGGSVGAATGPTLLPPDPAPLNPRRRIRAACRRVSAQVGYLNRLRVMVILCRTPLGADVGRRDLSPQPASAKPWE